MRPIFSILSAIANGKNTQAEIEAALGNKSIGGYLRRLIEDYNIIVRQRPILSKEGTPLSDMKYRITLSVSGLTILIKTALSLK